MYRYGMLLSGVVVVVVVDRALQHSRTKRNPTNAPTPPTDERARTYVHVLAQLGRGGGGGAGGGGGGGGDGG